MNKANKITMSRVIMSIIIIVLLLFPFDQMGIDFPTYLIGGKILIDLKYIIVGVLFIIASFTDFLDGYIARKYNMVTDFGKMIDAISDKLYFLSLIIILLVNKKYLIILKKKESKILDEDFIQTEVTSYTKANPYNLTLACKFINENDHCVIIDDFLANGEAATGAIRLLRKLHATIAGVGILVEKSYQPGRKKLEEAGIDVFSLARIKKLDTGIIEFVEE